MKFDLKKGLDAQIPKRSGLFAPPITILIPTKNEQECIGAVVKATKEALEGLDYELIVIDASTDNTPTEAAKAGAKVVSQNGDGFGDAMIQGFTLAQGQFVVFFDGDWTYDPNDIRKLLEPLISGKADLVNGNRFANMEHGAMPLRNRLGNVFLSWLGNLLFHTNIKDSQSGMKAFKRDMLVKVTLWESGFPFCSEIIAEASKLNMRIAEVGIKYRRRVGKSKLSPATAGLRIFWASFKMLIDYDPLFLFVEIGLVLEAIGFVVAWPVLAEYIQFGTFHQIGRALLAMFCWLAGLLSIFTGVILHAFQYSFKKIEARLESSRKSS